jgi:hypothetical protein
MGDKTFNENKFMTNVFLDQCIRKITEQLGSHQNKFKILEKLREAKELI